MNMPITLKTEGVQNVLEKILFLWTLFKFFICLFSHFFNRSVINMITQNLELNEFDLIKNLVTEQDQIIWESMGLPRDAQAIENAALLIKMIQIPFGHCATPIIIDPSETALLWFTEYLRNNQKSFDIISQNADKFPYALELAVRFGKILIILDCQDTQPSILQILFQRISCKFNKKQIQIGNKLIDLHDDFRLILFSKLINLEISTEIISYFAEIYFTITAVGLKDQLISKAILLKKPELEEKRIQLLKDEGNLLQQRIKLEDKLLEELSTAQGDILKNEKLLQTLNEVKESSEQIDNSLKNSSQIKQTLLEEFKQFHNICSSASNFYMNLIVMYKISVQAFINLFVKIFTKSDNTDEEKNYKDLIKSCFQYLCRSILKKDHIILGIFICKCAFPEQISSIEWETFITNFMNNADDTLGLSCPKWIQKNHIPKILTLISILPKFYKNLQLENENLWKNYIESNNNDNIKIPVQISPFQKILISQIFRPDLMLNAMKDMITLLIGIKITSISQPSVEAIYEESTNYNPILIITESDIDPSNEIYTLSKKLIGNNMYIELSVGKGMEKLTIDNIKKATESGKWICIKNIHLIPNLLIQINHELDNFNKSLLSKNFRLWIISDKKIKQLPESIMNKYIKILYELPNGLKNQIYHLIQQWYKILSENSTKNPKFIKLYIITFILNSIILERRKFIPQGWSKWYDFNESDLRSALKILDWMENYIKSSKLDWLILQGLYENIVYGGRINNNNDYQILIKYLQSFFDENVFTSKWMPLGLNISLPSATTKNIQEYYDAIDKIPDNDIPEIFGLSPLTNLSRNITLCKDIVKALRS